MMAPTNPASLARGFRSFGMALAITLILAASAAAQGISAHSGSTAGSTGDAGDGSGSRRSSRQTLISNTSTFQSRFAWNINADVGAASTRDTSGNAQHNMSFNVTAPGGYRLDVSESRVGIFQRNADVSGCSGSADISSLTGSQGGGTLTSGTLSIGDPGGLGAGGGTSHNPFNQSTSAQIHAVSNGGAVGHTLTFTWNGSVRSNSCEAAVRHGEGRGNTSGCGACEYPGDPSRTQANDGHFVTVSFTSLCGNGVVDASVSEQCDPPNGACCGSNCRFVSAGTSCRAAAGVCDAVETCSGSSSACPADAKLPSSTWRASATSPRTAPARPRHVPATPSRAPRLSVAPRRGSATWPRTAAAPPRRVPATAS
jgi:hypothetical protein